MKTTVIYRDTDVAYMNEPTCAACHGYRPSPQAYSSVGGEDGLHIGEISDCPLQIIVSQLDKLT